MRFVLYLLKELIKKYKIFNIERQMGVLLLKQQQGTITRTEATTFNRLQGQRIKLKSSR